jgi:parallel beta-helix repeat protein
MYKLVILVVVGLCCGAGAASATPPTATVSCGQTLTHSVRLANDLVDCPGEALIVGADGITIDLNGHIVDGTAAPADCDTVDFDDRSAGIDDRAGYGGLTIENGTVRQFQNGITAGSGTAGMSDSHLHDLIVRDNRLSGIEVGSGERNNDDNEIDQNAVTGNGCGFAVALTNAHANHVTDNRITHNALGVLVLSSDHNVVARNLISHSQHDQVIVCCGDGAYNTIRDNAVADGGESGIVLCCETAGQHTLITRNAISGNLHQGILLEDAGDNTVVANHVFGNGDDIVIDGDRNTITGNEVSDAIGCEDGCGFGIALDGGDSNIVADNMVEGTLLDGIPIRSFEPDTPANVNSVVRGNTVRRAGRDGIAAATEGPGPVSGLVLRANTVSRSGHDGIRVATTSATLGDNLAFRNVNLGIEAVPGVTDAGGNRAFANGNPLQCTNVLCG